MSYIMNDYDSALRTILDKGIRVSNRTGVDTIKLFGMISRYDISERFPLITGREIDPTIVWKELLWILRGQTNIHDLGCHIWDAWRDAEFEEKFGYENGDLGPIYGHQLRNFGGSYSKIICPARGADQLKWIIKELRQNPSSRRLLISLWNPNQLDAMRLPPCHVLFQLDVTSGGLSGIMYQRSCDFPVGVPFNIAFYAAFLHILAQQAELVVKEFVHMTADSHIYVNQIESIHEYLNRKKPDSPKLQLNWRSCVENYTVDDFELTEYAPLSKIKMPVAV